MLTAAIVVWSIAMIVSAFGHSFVGLPISRLGLGAVVATAFPAVASLAGDMFPSFERGRIWGYLLSGELLGTAVGFLVSGMLAGLVDWWAPFWLLGLGLAALIAWRLPEPPRGGRALEKPIEAFDIPARENRVLKENPAVMSLREAFAYVLSIRTNVALLVASSLGYFHFYFAGISDGAGVTCFESQCGPSGSPPPANRWVMPHLPTDWFRATDNWCSGRHRIAMTLSMSGAVQLMYERISAALGHGAIRTCGRGLDRLRRPVIPPLA